MVIEPQMYIILFGVIVGLIVVALMPRQQITKKDDLKDKIQHQPEKLEQLPEGVINRQQKLPSKKIEPQVAKQNEEQQQETLDEKRVAVAARKEKLLKSLTPKEREVIEEYFKAQREEIFEGKEPSREERRLRFAVKILGCGLYVLMIMVIGVLIIVAFGTTNYEEIQRDLELIALKLMQMMQGYYVQG